MNSLSVKRQTCRCRFVPPSSAGAGLAAALLLTLAGCSEFSVPVLRGSANAEPSKIPAVPADGSDPVAAECEQLRAQIRSNQEAVREAPSTSTSPQIVAAAQAKADKRIDDMRTRLDELDCPSSDSGNSGQPRRLAPVPPAPGAANP
jgi:hypothetical protein